MKKIIISEEPQNTLHISQINNKSLVIGISNITKDIYLVVMMNHNRYKIISLKFHQPWSWDEEFSSIESAVSHHGRMLTFYLLDNWKEIKEFIK